MPSSTVLFPSNPLNERQVDPEFEREWHALQFAGVQRALVTPDIERAMTNGESIFRNLPVEGGFVLYRGWMLSMQESVLLSVNLQAKGFLPVTSPAKYLSAHHLVNWIEIFDSITPKTAFVHPDASDQEILTAGESLGIEEFVVKDWVKSRKHEWDTAAYAPTLTALPAIVHEFVRLQGEFLVGQVAIREYVDLDADSGEQRLWWVNGELAMATGHPDTPAGRVELGQAFFNDVQARVRQLGSPFVTTDVASTADGRAIVIEVGDGQVSGLPANFDEDGYAAMIRQVSANA